MRAALAAAVVVLVLALAWPARAIADQGDAYYAATALEEKGDHAGAVAAFLTLADADPDDPFADDALIEAARLCEEKLADPARAADLYERLVRDYPQSRLAVRARRRAEALRAGMGAGGAHAAALAAWNDILSGYSERPRAESIARAERLLAEHPGFPLAGKVTLWIGEQHAEAGALDAALARFAEVEQRWPGAAEARLARRERGDVLVRQGRFDEAEAVYRSLREAAGGDPMVEITIKEAMSDLAAARRWARLRVVAWALIAAFVLGAGALTWRAAGSGGAAARVLARPPVEVWYLLPVAALLAGAGLSEHPSIGGALSWMCAAALGTAWLSGASLEAARRRAGRVGLARALGVGGGAVLAMAAVTFLAIWHYGLVDLVVHTARWGADR
jgi:TolA-binding protein